MGLSNTATPKYYGQFRAAVLRGEIPVNEYISLEMNRIDYLIAHPGVWYDEDAVEGWIEFCESELTLTDGTDLHLLDSFKLWAEQIMGWYYFVEKTVYVRQNEYEEGHWEKVVEKKRLITKQYLIVGRGAAKSLYDTCWHAYGLVVDESTTHQITTAPTMKMSEEVLSPLSTAITRARGPVFKFMTEGSLQNTTGNRAKRQKLCSTKKGIENFTTNSYLEIKPLSINKLQGLRVKYASLDEWLSGELRENPILAIEQGAKKEKDYLILASSSEGTVRNGCGDAIKMELIDILRGKFQDIHTSIWYYRLDSLEEINDPFMWLKANPNLGITVSYDDYRQEVERAENVPSSRNEIIAKRFGIPMEGFTYFFTYEETIPQSKKEFWKMPCSIGIDLSQGDDFCAFTFLFPLPNGSFGIKARSYISSLTYSHLNRATRELYDTFVREGSLEILEGNILDMMQVYDDLDAYILDKNYDVRCMGYDPYNAREFVERWEKEYGVYETEKVPQGVKTETVPLGEIKKLAGARLLIFDQEIIKFTMGNCVVLEDTNGNRKLWKKRYEDKIDNVSALLDAFVSYKLHKESFE